jgi:hypothetical protein
MSARGIKLIAGGFHVTAHDAIDRMIAQIANSEGAHHVPLLRAREEEARRR